MILMLNSSYKAKTSNTEYFLSLLKCEIDQISDKKCKIINIQNVIKNADIDVNIDALDNFAEELKQAEAFVIGAPLYVDGLPAQAVKLLEVLLDVYKGKIPKLPVYVVSNLGFYEAEQIRNLLAMVENWCKRMGMAYGGGLAVGAGPMARALEKMPLKKVILKDTGKGLEKLAYAIVNRRKLKNYYVRTMIPRMVYLKAAHTNFDRTIKENRVDNL